MKTCQTCGADLYEGFCPQCAEEEQRYHYEQHMRSQEQYEREMEELAYQEQMEEERRSNA